MHSLNLIVLLSTAATALAGHIHAPNHNEIARRSEGALSKRIFSPRITWYPTWTGPDACTGRNHGDYDAIVALNIPQWDNGAHCGKKIRITSGGTSVIGVIQDQCASCPIWGQIDLTKGLFQHFADLGKGEFTGEWEFIGEGDNGNNYKPKPKTHKKPKPTSTKKKTSTKTSSTHKSTSTSTSSSTSSTVSTTSTPPPSTTDDAAVGNVGAGPTPSEAPSVAGGIASDSHTNGAVSSGVNMILFGAATVMLAMQAL